MKINGNNMIIINNNWYLYFSAYETKLIMLKIKAVTAIGNDTGKCPIEKAIDSW